MSRPMYFLSPTSLYFSADSYDKEHVDAELDLLVVRGTEVIFVDAKNSVRDLNPEQAIRPTRRLQPNRLAIAIMEDKSPALRSQLDSIQTGLDGIPTSVELMTLNQWLLSDDPWLPGVAGRRIIRMGLGGMG